MSRFVVCTILIVCVIVLFPFSSFAQDYASMLALRLPVHRGELRGIEPDVLFAALDPVVIKGYLPRILPCRFRWKQWEYTNYAKHPFRRYLGVGMWGNYFYDVFGQPITRGWILYNWTQGQPRQFGSSLLKDQAYAFWFGRLVIAADSKGEYAYALSIGDEIYTMLTPLTFHKPTYNGVKWDFMSDQYVGTILFSRINSPILWANPRGIPDERTDNTHLLGGRVTAKITDSITVGATLVNAHQSQTLRTFRTKEFLQGALSTDQNKDISLIQLRLSDDSPEDGVGGAWLFSEDIFIIDREGRRLRGRDVGLRPLVEGGIRRTGYLAADGSEVILLTYDFDSDRYTGPRPAKVDHVTFRLELGNDYKVEITSDRQTNADNRPVFLTVTRAVGNVRDNTNQRAVQFDYGLPTGNLIYGFTLEVTDVRGFDLQAEWDLNRRYLRYPNRNVKNHHLASFDAVAWYVNASYRRYPWFVFGEGFGMDEEYCTTAFVVDPSGRIDYEDEYMNLYEFVDDNDDHDRYPDWRRFLQGSSDPAVLPGLDENNDGVSDFNQNDNPPLRVSFFPDYEEPFLRYSCDRPEYLFGMDMNNNGTIDRFENDELPDYPYKRDHRGCNVYVGSFLGPEVRWTVGHKWQFRPSDNKRDRTSYALFLADRSYDNGIQWRAFEHIKRVRDTIPDDLLQWSQPVGDTPRHEYRSDPLYAQNTWINTMYLETTYRRHLDFHFTGKFKYEVVRQRDSEEILRAREVRRDACLLGVLAKADWIRNIHGVSLLPRCKIEYLEHVPYLRASERRSELRETVSCVLRTGFSGWRKARTFKRLSLDIGCEFSRFDQLREHVPEGLEDDFWGVVGLVQMTHWTTYMGYRMIMQTGFRMNRQGYAGRPTRVTGMGFATVIAGIQG